MDIKKIKEKIIANKIDILIWACYTIFILIIAVVFHEKWRDEAQAWLLARDLNFIDLLKQMSYEGHPPLWHIILMPFAKLGFPYITESVISCAIMSGTAWLLLRNAPFKKSTQIILLLTSPFIYLYPAISRSYCIIALALVLIAIFYKDRRQKKVQYVLSILLLAYSHVIMLGVVGMLYLFFFIEEIFYNKKDKKETKELLISLAIAGIGLLILVALLFGCITKNQIVNMNMNGIDSLNIHTVKKLLYDMFIYIFGNLSYSYGFRLFVEIFVIFLILAEGKRNPENMLVAVVGILWQIFIYLFIWGVLTQRANTIILIGIFIAWIGREQTNEKKESNLSTLTSKIVEFGCLMILIFSIMQSVELVNYEIKGNYSDAKATAQYIEQNLDDDAIMICTDKSYASAIIPYTTKVKFWSPTDEKYFTYVTWDASSNKKMTIEEMIDKAKNSFGEDKNVYLLNCNNEEMKNEDTLKTLQNNNVLSEVIYKGSEKKCISDEVYDIYKIVLTK